MIIRADARKLPLRDACVQCCVTSPPYWGLRDYGTATWDGGDETCDHSAAKIKGRADYAFGPTSQVQTSNVSAGYTSYRCSCPSCGARRVDNQIGLEPTPDAYVASIVSVFVEVWRVLKDDGTCWLNLGDSYGSKGNRNGLDGSTVSGSKTYGRGCDAANPDREQSTGLASKQLVGIPWRVAFALQAEGWFLRSDIIWAKTNPMPESVTDRPTKSHEHLFLLAKSASYYYDAAAIAEPTVRPGDTQILGGRKALNDNIQEGDPRFRNGSEQWGRTLTSGSLRNKRDVWTINAKPYKGAHFATMPEGLIEPCILAGSRLGDLVLDPFLGTGTVGKVAENNGRRWVGTDLTYQNLSTVRTAERSLMSFCPEAFEDM